MRIKLSPRADMFYGSWVRFRGARVPLILWIGMGFVGIFTFHNTGRTDGYCCGICRGGCGKMGEERCTRFGIWM